MSQPLRIIFSAAIFCLSAGNAFGDGLSTYRNDGYGYAIDYPTAWYFHEGSAQTDIFSEEDAYGAENAAAGVSILIKEARAEDDGSAARAFERIAPELGDDVRTFDPASRVIAGEEWYAVSFRSEKEKLEGNIYVLVRGGFVYVLGSFYKLPGSRQRFFSTIENVIASFRFPPVEYVQFREEKLGVSFQRPSGSKTIVQPEVIMISLNGQEPGSSEWGASVFLGVIDPAEFDEKNLNEEEIFGFLMRQEEGIEMTTKPVRMTIAGKSWYSAEFVQDPGKLTVLLHNEYGRTFAVIYMVAPSAADDMYAPIFQVFLDSLSIDMAKWAALPVKGEE